MSGRKSVLATVSTGAATLFTASAGTHSFAINGYNTEPRERFKIGGTFIGATIVISTSTTIKAACTAVCTTAKLAIGETTSKASGATISVPFGAAIGKATHSAICVVCGASALCEPFHHTCGHNHDLAVVFAGVHDFGIVFACNGGLEIALAIACGFPFVSTCAYAVSLTSVFASACTFFILSTCRRPHHRLYRHTGDIATAYAGLTSKYPTSLSIKSPTNNQPLYLQQAQRVPTCGVMTKHSSLARYLMFAHKISKFQKFHKLGEIRGTSDPEGALISNIIKSGFFSNLITPVWQTFRHKLVEKCQYCSILNILEVSWGSPLYRNFIYFSNKITPESDYLLTSIKSFTWICWCLYKKRERWESDGWALKFWFHLPVKSCLPTLISEHPCCHLILP